MVSLGMGRALFGSFISVIEKFINWSTGLRQLAAPVHRDTLRITGPVLVDSRKWLFRCTIGCSGITPWRMTVLIETVVESGKEWSAVSKHRIQRGFDKADAASIAEPYLETNIRGTDGAQNPCIAVHQDHQISGAPKSSSLKNVG